jgi:release factor glutamine methyltransferase
MGEALARSISRLEKTSETPGLDAQVLLARLLNKPRSWILAHPEAPLNPDQETAVDAQVSRLEGGEPLPYILGSWEFYGLEFVVTPDVLIPRPETELLVGRAIYWMKNLNAKTGELRVVDVGTGSGCIAISLALNVAGIFLCATDISPAALKVARNNAERLHVSSLITFLECDLFPNSLNHDRFSLIAANPPYIPINKIPKIQVEGREPRIALDGGFDGLAFSRRILDEAPGWLLPGGVLLMETEASEGPTVVLLAAKAFPLAKYICTKTLPAATGYWKCKHDH